MGWSSENSSYKINKLSWHAFLEKKSAHMKYLVFRMRTGFNPDPELDQYPDPDPDPDF